MTAKVYVNLPEGSGSAIPNIEFIFFRFVNDLHLNTCKQLCKKKSLNDFRFTEIDVPFTVSTGCWLRWFFFRTSNRNNTGLSWVNTC